MINNVNRHKLNVIPVPPCLASIDRPPLQLFYRGIATSDWLSTIKVGVVGSRKMSPYGAYVTDKLVSAMAKVGITIISGLAYGVDAKAHTVALDNNGLGVAVLPTALDNIYPRAHHSLAERLSAQGGLITEYAPGSQIYKANFTERNRLIAGLADAVLIPEAVVNSGSLHTVRHCLNQGKPVLAVPGNINSPGSEGTNNLIKSGAIAVSEPGDIFLALGINVKKIRKRSFRGTALEHKLYARIEAGTTDQEELALILGISGAEVAAGLTLLEINGYIKPLGSGHWTSQI